MDSQVQSGWLWNVDLVCDWNNLVDWNLVVVICNIVYGDTTNSLSWVWVDTVLNLNLLVNRSWLNVLCSGNIVGNWSWNTLSGV